MYAFIHTCIPSCMLFLPFTCILTQIHILYIRNNIYYTHNIRILYTHNIRILDTQHNIHTQYNILTPHIYTAYQTIYFINNTTYIHNRKCYSTEIYLYRSQRCRNYLHVVSESRGEQQAGV